MNLQMLNAVGPGVAAGQMQAAQLLQQQQEDQQRQAQIAAAQRALQAGAWVTAPGVGDAFDKAFTPPAASPPGGSPTPAPEPTPSPPAAPAGGGAAAAQAPSVFARNQAYAKPALSYQTALTPADEALFNQWVTANKVPFDPKDPKSDYDMRGYWKDVVSQGQDQQQLNANDGKMHFPDTYKTPYHASFSNESRYAQPNAPKWANDHQLIDPQTGKVVFDERAPPVTVAPVAARLNAPAYFGQVLGLQGPAQINSAYRTVAQNTAAQGSPTSEHLTGNAWDIAVPPGMSSQDVAAKLAAAHPGFDQIIDEGNRVHIGFGPKARGQLMAGTPQTGYHVIGSAAPAAPAEGGDAAAPPTTPAAGSQPASPSGAAQVADPTLDKYDPYEAMRMTMHLADFIRQQYKVATGNDIGGTELLNQVKNAAEASSVFTANQKLAVTQAVAQLRADRSGANTQARVDQSNTNNVNNNNTSASNTASRVAQSGSNAQLAADTSRANTGDRVAQQAANAAMLDQRQRELAGARNQLQSDIAAGRNTVSSHNALVAAQGRLQAAQAMSGAAGVSPSIDAPAPTYLDAQGRPVAATPPAAAAGPAPVRTTPLALPPAARAQLKEGVSTTFGNGQVWSLKGGQPVRLK